MKKATSPTLSDAEIRRKKRLLSVRRIFLILLIIVLLEGIIAWIDYHRGAYVPASYFYILPVIIGGLYLGYWGGVGVPVLSIVLFHVVGKVFQHREYVEADIIWLLLLVVLGTITADTQAARKRDREQARELERLNRAREELTALIVHDLRTPLAGLLNVMRIFSEQEADSRSAEERQLLEVAMATGEDMLGMISDLLDLHALENNALRMTQEKLQPKELAAAALRQVAPLARQRGIATKLTHQEELPEIAGDEKLLKRVLVNLLGNALRFAPADSTIEVALARRGSMFEFSVSDQGPGIPDHLKERIFEKFASIDHDAGKHISTGLGLAFSKMATEAHRGRIWVDSPCFSADSKAGGYGSCFHVSVPLPGSA